MTLRVPGHRMEFDGQHMCSCGWRAPLGKSVWREFDKHLLALRAPEQRQNITGTYFPCASCQAPMVWGQGIQQRVTISGDPSNARLTPHTGQCLATTEDVVAQDPAPFSIGPF